MERGTTLSLTKRRLSLTLSIVDEAILKRSVELEQTISSIHQQFIPHAEGFVAYIVNVNR